MEQPNLEADHMIANPLEYLADAARRSLREGGSAMTDELRDPAQALARVMAAGQARMQQGYAEPGNSACRPIAPAPGRYVVGKV